MPVFLEKNDFISAPQPRDHTSEQHSLRWPFIFCVRAQHWAMISVTTASSIVTAQPVTWGEIFWILFKFMQISNGVVWTNPNDWLRWFSSNPSYFTHTHVVWHFPSHKFSSYLQLVPMHCLILSLFHPVLLYSMHRKKKEKWSWKGSSRDLWCLWRVLVASTVSSFC